MGLKASERGLERIKEIRKNSSKWKDRRVDNEEWLKEASKVLNPNWKEGDAKETGIYFASWKRFLSGKETITENAFKAYCQVLGLNWEDIVEKGLTPEELEKRLIEKTPSMKAEIERFSTQRIAEGNRKRATISSWNFDGNLIYFQVELHYHQIWNTPWGQMTAYQADTLGRGEFNPYDLTNIQNAQICVEVPPIIALALNKTDFCVSLAPIADKLFINNNT